jgi:hypothetical protein
LDAAPDWPYTEKRLHVLYQMHYQHLTTIMILTGVWKRAGSTGGNSETKSLRNCIIHGKIENRLVGWNIMRGEGKIGLLRL